MSQWHFLPAKCLLQSLHVSQPPIKATDLHTLNDARASAALSSEISFLYFSPSDQLTLHPLCLPPSQLCVPPFITLSDTHSAYIAAY